MKARRSAIIASVAALMAAAFALPFLAGRTAQAAATRQVDESPCIMLVDRAAAPRILLLGEAATVTVRITPFCPAEVRPLRISMVLDASQRMSGQPLRELQDGAVALVKALELPNRPNVQVGIVSFRSSAKTDVELTNEESRLLAAIRRLEASGGTAIHKGIEAGARQLASAGRDRGGSYSHAMVVISQGVNDKGCAQAAKAAGSAKNRGILVIAVCVSPACDATCMRSIASAPRYFRDIADIQLVSQDIQRWNSSVVQVRVTSLSVREALPADMQFVVGSARPPQDSVDPSGRLVTWEPALPPGGMPLSGITLTYRVRPLAPGYRATSDGARVWFEDSKRRTRSVASAVPYVHVLKPQLLATPAP